MIKLKRLYKNWLVHNMLAHPAMYLIAYFDVKLSRQVHDATLPDHDAPKGDSVIFTATLLYYGAFAFGYDLANLLWRLL